MRELKKIDATTYYVDDEFVRCFLLIGQEKALWIDTGVSGLDLVAMAKEVTDLPLIVVNTHGDGDHMASNKLFPEYMITETDYKCCESPAKITESKAVFVKDGDVIELGNRPVTIWLVPGHTKGSIVLYDGNNRRLFSGDTVQTENVFMFGEHRDRDNYAGSLAMLSEKKDMFDEIYASHGTPVLDPSFIDILAAGWDKVLKGEVETVQEDFFGMPVNVAKLDGCGFLI